MTATNKVKREVAGRKAYGYSLDDGNGTQPLLFKVRDHVTSDSNIGLEFGNEMNALP